MASYGERRRHYRVGKKAAQHACHTGPSKCCKGKYIACAVIAAIVIFAKGVLVGMIMSKEKLR